MGYATLTVALLLLIQCGREGAALTISSNSSGNVLTGKNISLDISYNIVQLPAHTAISWAVNNSAVVTWFDGVAYPTTNYTGRLWIIGQGSLLISNAIKNDTGTYVIQVNAPGETPAMRSFQVNIYDAVVNASVTGAPQSVDEKAQVTVKVTCNASGDIQLITWTKDGQPLAYNDTYSLLDGNKTLQIKYPNRTHAGNYTCNVSNPVSWDDALWELTVSYTDGPAALSAGAIAGIVIGSVLGGLILITLIILLLVICIRKRKSGIKKKIAEPQHKDVLRTVSGNTLSPDDPAYFTMNNIMYRNSSISMGSYIMNYNDNMSDYDSPSSKPPSSPPRVKHATQV